MDEVLQEVEAYQQRYGHEVELGGCFHEENIAKYLSFLMKTLNKSHFMTALMYQKVHG